MEGEEANTNLLRGAQHIEEDGRTDMEGSIVHTSFARSEKKLANKPAPRKVKGASKQKSTPIPQTHSGLQKGHNANSNAQRRTSFVNRPGRRRHVDCIGEDFEAYGYPVPAQYNPADWIIDVAQGNALEDLEKSSFFSTSPDNLLDEIATKNPADEGPQTPTQDSVSVWKEFTMLQQREMTDLVRNPAGIVINVVVTGILSVIFGVIFFDIGNKDRTEYSVRNVRANGMGRC